MKLGPIQTQWIANLKAHPERQLSDYLGQGDIKDYKACCLGELLICKHKAQRKKVPFVDGFLWSASNSANANAIIENYQSLGLYTNSGHIREDVRAEYPKTCLALLNDEYLTWPEIAELVEANPDHFFTKSY